MEEGRRERINRMVEVMTQAQVGEGSEGRKREGLVEIVRDFQVSEAGGKGIKRNIEGNTNFQMSSI